MEAYFYNPFLHEEHIMLFSTHFIPVLFTLSLRLSPPLPTSHHFFFEYVTRTSPYWLIIPEETFHA